MSEESIASGSGIHREEPRQADLDQLYDDAFLVGLIENDHAEGFIKIVKENADIVFRTCALCIEHDRFEFAEIILQFKPTVYFNLPPLINTNLLAALAKHHGNAETQEKIFTLMRSLFASPQEHTLKIEFYAFLIQAQQFDLLKAIRDHQNDAQNDIMILAACPQNDLEKLLDFKVIDKQSRIGRLLDFSLKYPDHSDDPAALENLLNEEKGLFILILLSARLQKETLLDFLVLRAKQEHPVDSNSTILDNCLLWLLLNEQDISCLKSILEKHQVKLKNCPKISAWLIKRLFMNGPRDESTIQFLLNAYKNEADAFKKLIQIFFDEQHDEFWKAKNLGLNFTQILRCLAQLEPEEKRSLLQALKQTGHYATLIQKMLESCYQADRMDLFAQVYRAYPEEKEVFYQKIQQFFCVCWSAETAQILQDIGIDLDDYLKWQREHLRNDGLLLSPSEKIQHAVVLRDLTQLEQLLPGCDKDSDLCQNAICFAALYAWEEGLALLRSRGLINANELHQLLRQLHEQGYHTRGQATLESTDIKLIDLELKFLKNSIPSVIPGCSFEKILRNYYIASNAHEADLFRQLILAYILKGGKHPAEVLFENIYCFTPSWRTPDKIPFLIYWFRNDCKMVIKMLESCKASLSDHEEVLEAVSRHLGTPLASTYQEAIQNVQIRALLAEERSIMSAYEVLMETSKPASPEARPLAALLSKEVVYEHALLLRRRYTAGLYQPAEGVDENVGSRTSHKLLGAPSS